MEFDTATKSIQFCGSKSPVVALGWFVVSPKGPKLVYRHFVSFSNVKVRMRLSGLYRMSEDVIYPSSVLTCLFCGMWSSIQPNTEPIFCVEEARFSIVVVRSVVQRVQNWFTGISFPSRRSRLG